MGTKNNPGEFDCYANADRDEPLFVLRASDPLAPMLVRNWAECYRMQKTAEDGTPTDKTVRKYTEALECADQMAEWYNHNREE